MLAESQRGNRFHPADKEKHVRDIMRPIENFSSVSADTSIKNAVYILDKLSVNNIDTSHLLVYENKKLVGIIGIKELLHAVEPHHMRERWYRGWNISNFARPNFWTGLFTCRCATVSEKPVRDIIRPITTTLSDGMTLSEAVHQLIKSKGDTLPVSKNNSVVGLIYCRDIFREISKIMEI